jgi:cytochrome c553
MSRTRILSIIVSSVPLACMSADAGAQIALDEVAWAYAIGAAPAQPTEPDDGTLHSVPGSERQFTRDQIRNFFGPADWFPGDHPVMPPIVAQGREPAAVWACSMCHYPNGQGRPENAGIAGLPRDYFIQQMRDLRDGRRGSAEPRKTNTNLMIGFARAMTDREIEQAADYFSSMAWRPWIDVIETEQVPKTRIQGGMHLRLEGAEAGTEPIGLRIVEMPIDTVRTEELRDPRSGFVAYVPAGSVARGEALASGAGKTLQCSICHGIGLDGLGAVPGLRGRSPSYIARQLFDFQQGTRNGAWGPLMSAVVVELTGEDVIDLAAYLASLPVEP